MTLGFGIGAITVVILIIMGGMILGIIRDIGVGITEGGMLAGTDTGVGITEGGMMTTGMAVAAVVCGMEAVQKHIIQQEEVPMLIVGLHIEIAMQILVRPDVLLMM